MTVAMRIGGVSTTLALLVAMLGAVGCELLESRAPTQEAVVPAAPPLPDDDDRLAWAESEPWFVVVRKSCRTLDVYQRGQRVESFPAVFGQGGSGRKLHEGDRKTPLGLYAIVDKRPHARWQEFLLLDYPNLEDMHRYRLAMESDRLPRQGDRYAGIGGLVGIHGTDKPEMNRRDRDWTWGCISLGRDDIRRLSRLVPLGTPVLIVD